MNSITRVEHKKDTNDLHHKVATAENQDERRNTLTNRFGIKRLSTLLILDGTEVLRVQIGGLDVVEDQRSTSKAHDNQTADETSLLGEPFHSSSETRGISNTRSDAEDAAEEDDDQIVVLQTEIGDKHTYGRDESAKENGPFHMDMILKDSANHVGDGDTKESCGEQPTSQ